MPQKKQLKNAQVGIIMGSDSDLTVMEAAAKILKEFDIAFELTIVSAHRTPKRMTEYATSAQERGIKVIIAGAGGAAHLPGMVASLTTLPVIGVPIKSSNSVDGWDSILSILQMPNGVPVATVALNAAKNAGILASEILATSDEVLSKKLSEFKKGMEQEVISKAEKIKENYR
jgi:5-(carboxyamino)imidazole ribonucleotide mutase